MKSLLFRLCLVAGALFLATAAVRAQDLGAVRARMEQRLSRVDALKARGALGENNRGFLEVRGGRDEEAAALAAEENRDRETVYAAIAKQTGSTPAAVGAARAKQIAANSAAGVWLQRENGEWYRK